MTNLHAVAKKYDPGTFDALWVSAKAQGGITLGTLFHHAQAAGWDSSNPSDDVTDSDQDVPPWVLELNKYFAWVEEQAEIYRIEFDDFIKPHAFRTQLNNEIVEKQTAKGSQWVGKGTQWLKEKGRRQHKGLVLRPKEGRVTADNCLNVWRGFAVERTPGTVVGKFGHDFCGAGFREESGGIGGRGFPWRQGGLLHGAGRGRLHRHVYWLIGNNRPRAPVGWRTVDRWRALCPAGCRVAGDPEDSGNEQHEKHPEGKE